MSMVGLRDEKQVRAKLKKLRTFGKKHRLIDEMHGEVYALEYVLEERDDFF